jgi:DNA-dependent RNA polymerase auxiliary subunit epsilon
MAHKCFISFKTEDMPYKEAIQKLNLDLIDKSLDEAIDSDNEDYIMQVIRRDYLSDSTVTIHLIGANSGEHLGYNEQKYIKRELQASLYDGEYNTRNGILGIVLPSVYDRVYTGSGACLSCTTSISYVNINDSTTVREFNYNYYLPHGKCHHTEEDRYCVLVKWDDFIVNPSLFIEQAFAKRDHPISNKVKVRP